MTAADKRLRAREQKIEQLEEELRQYKNANTLLQKDNMTLRETVRALRDFETFNAGKRAWAN